MNYRFKDALQDHTDRLIWFGHFFGLAAVIWAVGTGIIILGLVINNPTMLIPAGFTGPVRGTDLNALRWMYVIAALVQGVFTFFCLKGAQTLFNFFAVVASDMVASEIKQQQRREAAIKASQNKVD